MLYHSSMFYLVRNEANYQSFGGSLYGLVCFYNKSTLIENNSILRDSDQALQNFSWELVWNELTTKAPTLLHLYKRFFRGAPKPLICFAASLIIKWRSCKMCLVQRVISTLLYGHGTSKQVKRCTVYIYIHNHVCFSDVQLFTATYDMLII